MSKSRKRRDRRKRLALLRPCPPANQGVRAPLHSRECLFDWFSASAIDLGQLRNAIKSGQLLPTDKGRNVLAAALTILDDDAADADRVLALFRVALACDRADLRRLREALGVLRPGGTDV